MTRRLRLAGLFASALALAAAPPAAAWTVNGAADVGFQRADTFDPVASSVAGAWDWGVGLGIGDLPVSPGLLQLSLNGAWRQSRSLFQDLSSRFTNLSYGANATLLGASPAPLTLSALRNRLDYAVNETSQQGLTETTSFTGAWALNVPRYPSLSAVAGRTDSTNKSFGNPETTSGATTLQLGTAYTLASQSLSATYNTSWNDGTYAETNYRSHQLTLTGAGDVTRDIRYWISDSYFLRDPLVESVFNPRYDSNSFSTGLGWKAGGTTNTTTYGYNHGLVAPPGGQVREVAANSLSQSTAFGIGPDVQMAASLSLNQAVERLDLTQARAFGEALGLNVNWRHAYPSYTLTLGSGGSLGAYQGGGSSLLSYVASLYAGAETTVGRTGLSASYSLSYSGNSQALAGSGYSQNLLLRAVSRAGPVSLLGDLTAAASRSDSPLLGTSFARSITGSLTTGWRRYSAQLTLGWNSGLAEALQRPGFADGLFIPAPYNTESAFAMLTAGATFGRLGVFAMGRTAWSTYLERPSGNQQAVSVTASYRIGLWSLRVDDRYSVGGVTGFRAGGNLFFVHLTRSFEASF